MSRFRSLLALGLLLIGSPAWAHEFWISPEAYLIESGEEIQADLRVGQEFKGSAYPYNPARFERFDLVQNGKSTSVQGRLGDRPALNVPAEADGLVTIVHETTDSRLTYREWAKFEKFATHKDFKELLAEHRARGLPDEDFVELYRRFAKSLVAVGSARGSDSEVGLRTEIIALANPYTDAISHMPIRLMLDGNPRADAQIELFDRAPDGAVEITLHRTDAQGEADLPVTPGHDYLVDAVTMIPLEADDVMEDPVWYSLWAAMSFAVPQTPLE